VPNNAPWHVPTIMKGAVSCFKGDWVVPGCLREFQSRLMLNDVKNLVDRDIQGGECDGAFGLRCRWGSVLLGSLGSVPPYAFPRAVGLKALVVIMWHNCFGVLQGCLSFITVRVGPDIGY